MTEQDRAYFKNIRKYMNTAVDIAKTNDDDAIRVSGLFNEWSQTGVYAVGDVVKHEDYPYKCIIGHTASHYSGWQANLWSPYHGRTPDTALPYVMYGGHTAYMAGEYCVYGDRVWLCLRDNTPYNPDEDATAWEAVG